ncbi:MAG: hypothetical protein LBM06_01350 [Prevotellaceae bacterium]|jgi:outer membrane protein assembly factor BamB|nr:hypothetical protein [Prevotellaceae bacterium]
MKHQPLLRLLIGFICAVAVGRADAQVDSLVVGTKSDGTPLMARCYTFAQRVQNFSVSEDGNYLCLRMMETTKKGRVKPQGHVGYYNLTDNKLHWMMPINFNFEVASPLSEGMLVEHGKLTALYNREDGQALWSTQIYPISVSDSLGYILGYNSPTSSRLKVVDLKSGEELWRQKIPHQYGWSGVYEAADRQLLIVADDLHKLNLQTGELLTYKGVTGVVDKTGLLLKGLVTVATVAVAGAAMYGASGGTGTYTYVPYYYGVPSQSDVLTAITSNVLITDSCYYWADRNHIVCLDTTLNVLWKTPFEDKASQSHLFMQDDKLYMLNYGYVMKGAVKRKYGRPFIACYHPQTGEELFLNRLTLKRDILEDAVVSYGGLFGIFDDGVSYQSLTDSITTIVPWNKKVYGTLVGNASELCYAINADSTAFDPLLWDGEHCLVYNASGDVYELDTDIRIRNTYPAERVYRPAFTLRDYLCVGQRDDHWFIHHTGMPVAHLTTSFEMGRVVGNKLLLLQDHNRLLTIDLDEAIR